MFDAHQKRTDYRFDDLGRRTHVIGSDADGIEPLWRIEEMPLDIDRDGVVDNDDRDVVDDILSRRGLNDSSVAGYFEYAWENVAQRYVLDLDGPEFGSSEVSLDVDADGKLTSVDLAIIDAYLIDPSVDPVLFGSRPATQYVYDAASNLRFIRDPMGSVTEFQFDARDRRTFTIGQKPSGPRRMVGTTEADSPLDPGDLVVAGYPGFETIYDDAGRVDQRIDYRMNAGWGRTSDYSWNNLDQLTQLELPDPDGVGSQLAPIYAFTYDLLGNRTSATDAENNTTDYVLDNLYRVFQVLEPTVANPAGGTARPTTTYHYDAASQPWKRVDPLNREWETKFDELGRVTQEFSPDPTNGLANGSNRPYRLFEYDLVGNRTEEQNALAQTKSWTFDALNRLLTDTNEINKTSVFSYDLVGNMLSLEDPNENVTAWQYDGLNRQNHEINELEKERFFKYDLVGNLVEKTDRRGWIMRHDYDHLYRATAEHWYGGPNIPNTQLTRTIAFQWDLAGNLLSASDPDFDYDFAPDQLDRIWHASLSVTGLAKDVELAYAYDRMGNRTQVAATLVNGPLTTDFTNDYEFDELNRLILTKQHGTSGGNGVAEKRVDMRYDLAGQMFDTQRRAGLLTTSQLVVDTNYEFDKAGRITLMDHVKGTPGGTPSLASHAWEWDVANRIEEYISGVDGTAEYGYDWSGQLYSADYTGYGPFQLNESYLNDNNGNRVLANYSDENPLEKTAYWEAEDGTGSTLSDSSGNGITAAFVGTNPWSTGTGNVAPIPDNDYSVYFDASGEYLNITNATALQVGTGDFSASAWVKFDSSFNQDMMIMAHGNPNTMGGKGIEFLYRAGQTNKPLVLRINDAYRFEGQSFPAQQVSYLTAGSLADNAWHHLGFTIDRDGQIVLYVDGLAVRAANNTKTANINPTTPFYMGRANAGPTNSNLRGRIDEVRVYHSALLPHDLRNQFLAVDNSYSANYDYDGQHDNNQMLSDGSYSYTYDAEGNRATRHSLLGMGTDTYTWDHRNRLVNVSRTAPREVVQFDFESAAYQDLIIDALANATDGFLENGAAVVTTDSHGEHDMAVNLDGTNDFGNLGIQDWFKLTAEGLSLAAWMKPGQKASETGIFAFGGTGTNEAGYSLSLGGHANSSTPTQIIFRINDGSGAAQTMTYTHTGPLLNQWNHLGIAIDPDSDELKLYLNGNLVDDWVITESLAWGQVLQPFVMGALTGGTTNYFQGQLDDIRVVPYSVVGAEFTEMWQTISPEFANTLSVSYLYDHQNRLIGRTENPDGEAGPQAPFSEFFIHDGTGQSTNSARLDPDNLEQVGQIVLRLDAAGNVKNRYLWNAAAVDQLLADEPVDGTPGEAEDVLWALTDHLGTVRDLVRYDDDAEHVETVLHRAYDGFGRVTSESNPEAVEVVFGFTGRMLDEATGLQNNLNRWYDADAGKWASEDAVGFHAGARNLSLYVNNSTTISIDSSGLRGTETGIDTDDETLDFPEGTVVIETDHSVDGAGNVGAVEGDDVTTYDDATCWSDVECILSTMDDGSVSALVIIGHGHNGGAGSSGGGVDGESLDEDDDGSTSDEIDRALAPDAPIVFLSCDQDDDFEGDNDEYWLQDLSNDTGHDVIYNDGPVYFREHDGTGWYSGGSWHRVKPE